MLDMRDKFKQLIGLTFGRLTVAGEGIRPPHVKNTYKYWLCRCECGNEKTIISTSLTSGSTLSCGCLRNEAASRWASEMGKRKRTHGHSIGLRTPEYRAWAHMWSRCTNPNTKDWPLYGGIGVKVCARWKAFELFLKDMGYRPSNMHSIDRYPNNCGNYEPGNCRWATASEQGFNKRITTERNVIWKFKGQSKSTAQWARELSMSSSALNYRINKWGLKAALTTPRRWW